LALANSDFFFLPSYNIFCDTKWLIYFFMSPAVTFFVGLTVVAFLGWYWFSETERSKRWIGVILTVLTVAFCLQEMLPLDTKIRLGLDLKGGTSFLMKLTPVMDENGKAQPITPDMLEQAVEVIRKRVDAFGGSEPVIAPIGSDRILVQIPGLDTSEVDRTQRELQRVARLELASVAHGGAERIARIEAGEEILPPDLAVRNFRAQDGEEDNAEERGKLLVKRIPEISGDHLRSAHPFFDQQGWGVSFVLDSEGARLFSELTTAMAPNGHIAILLDGEVYSYPTVKNPIHGGSAQITGNFTEKQARDLASVLMNPLRTPMTVEETRSVSPSLGADAIRSGVLAGIGGFLLTVLFVLLYYRLAGIVAFIGLTVNIILLFGLMSMFHFVLTLPGIAGIILTIGMAVDANVLIYERLREEMAKGKSLAAAIDAAYEKAFSAIFDANITTIITSVILMWQSSGSVRGFAITLTLGVTASMFSALTVTRTIFRWLERSGLQRITMMDLIPKRRFNFLGTRRVAFTISAIALAASVIVIGFRGKDNLGIDFRGGDMLMIDSEIPISVGEARDALRPLGLESSRVQDEHEGTHKLLSFRIPNGTSQQVLDQIVNTFSDRGVTEKSRETVGPTLGWEFAKRGLWALALSMVGILIYVTIRFEFSFALATVLSLIHVIIITLGIFSLVGGELSQVMIGAILAVVGYAINDTIVVFDRIRETFKNNETGTVASIMNRAINETLGRTILTSGSTIVAVLALYIFGGAVLRDFSFVMMIGIIGGTYSTIFIAAPIVLWYSKLTGKSVREEIRETEALASRV